MPVRFVNTEKALKVNKRIAQICSVALLGTLVGLASCQSKLKKSTPIVDTRITCTTIQPIEYVKSDSRKTKEAIVAHNAVWDYYCNQGGNNGR